MSSIDERIVEMRFDNDDFEQGVRTSLVSLSKLKEGLNLDASARSLSNLERVGSNFALNGLADSVQVISDRFSALGIMGVTALQNITNSAVNAGKRILNALTLDPIKTGYNEYELKMDSIKTIMASTGEDLETVNKYLAELNEYSDQTIYSFSDMTSNIGKFTNAGVKLEDAVMAIKGISNEAARSGANANEASRAMYNFAQALSTGSVKLIDWKSIENANMATVEFKEELIETALRLGTVVKIGDQYKSVTTDLQGKTSDLFTSTTMFNDSLSHQWMTTDVLVETLKRYADATTEIGRESLQAATEVNTVSKLFDTMKESVQSGWAVSWEYIIGDKDQAIKTLTAINDAFSEVSGSISDSRNELLRFWNENGGRDALIESLSTVINIIKKLIKPIGEAFRELFPKATGQQFVDITNKFKEFVQGIQISEKTISEIKMVFTGLFSVVDAGITIVKTLATGLFGLLSKLTPLGSGVWNLTVIFANFLNDVSKAATSTNILTGIFSALDTMLNSIGTKLKGVTEFLGDLYSLVKRLAGGLITSITNEVSTLIENLDFTTVFNIISAGLLTAVIKKVKDFVDNFVKLFDKGFKDLKDGFGLISGLTDILDTVRSSLETWQNSLNVKMLTSIGIAIAMISASLVALSTIDSDKLVYSLGGIGVLLVELVGSLAMMQYVFNGVGTKAFLGLHQMSALLIGLSTSILILSKAMDTMSDLDLDGISRGLVGVAGLSAIVVVTADHLSKSNAKLIKGSTGLIVLSGAIMILSQAVKQLGSIDFKSLVNGLLGVGVLCVELSFFFENTNLDKAGVFKGLGIMAVAGAITILASAVEQISKIDVKELTKGVISIGALLAELSLFVNYTSGTGGMLLTATSMAVLTASLLGLSVAIKQISDLDLPTIGKSLIGFAGGLIILSKALKAMNGTLAGSAALLVATTAVSGMIFSLSKSEISKMSIDEVKNTLILFAGGLIALAVGLKAMNGTLAGSAALLVASGALIGIATAIRILRGVDIKDVVVSLGVLVGAFGTLAIAAGILSKIAPMMLTISGALLAFGAAVAVVGVGTLALGVGLTSVGAGLASIIALGGTGLSAFADSVVTVFDRIIDLVPKFIQTITATLPTEVPKMIDALVNALSLFLARIVERVPEFVQAGLALIRGLLNAVRDNVGDIVSSGIQIAVNFVKGVASKIPDIIQAGMDLIISFLNGIADGLRNNSKKLSMAISNVVSAILETAMDVALGFVRGFLEVGVNIVDGFIDGMCSMITSLVKAVSKIGKTIINALTTFVSKVYSIGADIVRGFVSGIKDRLSDVVSIASTIGETVINKVKDILDIHSPSREMYTLGEQTIEGYVGGLESMEQEVIDAAHKIFEESFGNALDNTIKKVADSMEYGSEAFIAYMESFGMVSGKYETIKAGIEATSKAMTDYGKKLYEESEYYKEDNEALRENQEELKRLKQTRKELQNELEKYNKKNDSESKKRVTQIKNELEQTKEAIQETTDAIADYPNQVLAHTQEVYSQLAESISSSIEKSIDPLTLSLNTQIDLFKKFEVETEEFTEDILANMESQIIGITDWNNAMAQLAEKGFAKGLLDQLESMGPTATAYINQFMFMTAEEVSKANELFQESTKLTAQALITNFEESLDAAKNWAINMQTLSKMGLNQDVIENLGDMGIASAEYVNAFMSMSSEQIDQFNKQYAEYLTLPDEVTNQVIASFVNAGVGGATGFTDSIITEIDPNGEAAKTIEENAKTIGAKLTASLSEGIKSKKGSVKNSSTSVSKAAYGALNTYMNTERGTALGTEICMGLILGLQDNQSAVSAAARDVAAAALAAAQAELDIHSPSRKFRELGRFADEGFVQGLLAYAKNVSSAASDVGKNAVDGLKNSIARIANVVNNDIDSSPVIRPVIDLTNVRMGVDELNSMLSSNKGLTLTATNANVNGITTAMRNQNVAAEFKSSTGEDRSNVFSFVQNNYSPVALSRKDIYRQTNNQFSAMKEVLSKI